MKKILTSLILVASGLAFAQVGINAGTESTDPHQLAQDAVLHVENVSGQNKGVLLPSVALTSDTDQTTTSAGTVTTGLMVWNDGTGGLTPAGYYYWNGTKWVLTGNVEEGVSETNLGFVKATFKKVDGTVPASSWDDNTFTVIGTGDANLVTLPDATGNNTGRVISFRNQSSSQRNYGGNYQPANNTTINAGRGHLLQSDGENWYVIGGF